MVLGGGPCDPLGERFHRVPVPGFQPGMILSPPKDVAPLLHGAATMAFSGDAACLLLVGQRLIGEKRWVK